MSRQIKAVTLIELLIAIVIMTVVILSFNGMDMFSRRHVIATDRRVKTQNEAAYVIEFMAKELTRAIGDQRNPPASIISIGTDPAIAFWVDQNQNGLRDSSPTDRQIAFSYRGSPNYEMRYYPDFSGNPANYEVLSSCVAMSGFGPVITDNYVTFEITACWDPKLIKTTSPCGSLDNPRVTMHSRVSMPSVSTN